METDTLLPKGFTRPTPVEKMDISSEEEIGQKVKLALDGRPARWLALRTNIPDDYLSRKIKGAVRFTIPELKRIAVALNIEFTIGPDPSPPSN